jgi:hypothetical protein
MSRSGNFEALTSELQHLGHERHVVQGTLVVQRLQNLFWAKHFHPFADPILHVALPPLPALCAATPGMILYLDVVCPARFGKIRASP